MSLAEELRGRLGRWAPDWPGTVEHFTTVASTNDVLRERARAGAPEWSVVVADEQTAGRGRHGRAWVSRRGDLFLSVLVEPQLPPDRLGLVSLAAGLAVADAAHALGVEAASLKWPNDVVAEGRKLAGVLVEGVTTGAAIEAVVVGVGMNLALDPQQAPGPLRETATSVGAVTGRVPAPVEAADETLRHLRLWYHALRAGGDDVLAAWQRRAAAWWGREVEARSGDGLVRGLARGLDPRGALLLEQTDGSRIAILSGEVREVQGPERSRPGRERP